MRGLDLQKWGGFAALGEALLYIVGFTIALTVLAGGSESLDAAQKLERALNHRTVLQVTSLLIYVVFGVLLVLLVAALRQRLYASAPALSGVASAFGFIWAGLVISSGMLAIVGLEAVAVLHATEPDRAATVWMAVAILQDALGGGVEVVGGLWVLLITLGARGALPRAVNALGYLVGLAGVLTAIPGLGELGAVFGLGQIVWFAGVGFALLRR